MMKSVESLQKKAKKGATPEVSAFQLLFLLVGINLFKVPIVILQSGELKDAFEVTCEIEILCVFVYRPLRRAWT